MTRLKGENMNRTAFICPLYDMKNHFDLATDLYKSKIEHSIDSDLIFIFSNAEQKDKFAERLKNELGVENMLYSIIPEKLNVYSAKAVTKKLYGLQEYMKNYEYIVLTDCEAVFVRNFNADELAKEIWESKSMLASNISANGFFIMRRCYKAMGLYYNEKLRKALGLFKYNFWFNELQVYKCSYLPDFFEWLNRFDIEKIYNTWDCFEYYVFYAYLCLVHNMEIKKYHYLSLGGINEYMYTFSLKKQKRIVKKMNLHWTSSGEVLSDDIVMRFHLDRTKQTGNYGYIDEKIPRMIMYVKLIVKRYLTLIREIPEMLQEQKK